MDLFAFRKPKNELESDEGESKNVPFVPEEMWIKCPKCNTMLLTTDMEENLHVCTKCNHHFRMNGRDRVEMLADKDTFVEFDADLSSHNILDFPGYDEKLEKARKTGAKESVICGECKMNGIDTVLCVMDPTFMMGSTDGLTNMVEDEEICSIILRDASIEERAGLLVKTANDNGGKDNITVMIIEPFS